MSYFLEKSCQCGNVPKAVTRETNGILTRESCGKILNVHLGFNYIYFHSYRQPRSTSLGDGKI